MKYENGYSVLFNLIIPIIEFFLSIICIYYLFQMGDSRYTIFSLYCLLIMFKSFFGIVSGVCKVWLLKWGNNSEK